MQRADATLPMAPGVTDARVHGWGGGAKTDVRLCEPETVEALRSAVLAASTAAGAIARGMGRSYGDAAQLAHGLVLATTRLKRIELDAERGVVTAQAGVTIGELLEKAGPSGWIVPVVPGTQHVTVGGAIAGDIHGKNHGRVGTFGSHVQALGLLTAAGELVELERADPFFEATLGGMGLTGVVVWARIALRAVSGPLLAVDTDRVRDLDRALEVLSEPGGPHRVAWLDLLSSAAGRGIVTRAAEIAAPDEQFPGRDGAFTVPSRATVPERWPAFALRPLTVTAFNELRYRRAPRRARGRPEAFGQHMFPLDGLAAWPRLYGARGFVQYQLVVPPGQERVLRDVVEQLRRARVPCFLAVLKDFGPANEAPLSFPMRGWTLALDLPRAAPGLNDALDRCDRLVAEAGGRVYLSKDSRLAPETVAAMYPRLEEWREVRDRADPDGLWRSDLALRTELVRT